MNDPLTEPVREALVDSVTEPVVETVSSTISIDDAGSLWSTLSSMCYDNFQPINELCDNAIAAIIALTVALISGDIYITFNFSTNMGSIEHSGGVTFPTDPDGLKRCFTVGGKQQTSLNEHGSGLKSSLAISSNSKQILR